jgi:hypothetical protein
MTCSAVNFTFTFMLDEVFVPSWVPLYGVILSHRHENLKTHILDEVFVSLLSPSRQLSG